MNIYSDDIESLEVGQIYSIGEPLHDRNIPFSGGLVICVKARYHLDFSTPYKEIAGATFSLSRIYVGTDDEAIVVKINLDQQSSFALFLPLKKFGQYLSFLAYGGGRFQIVAGPLYGRGGSEIEAALKKGFRFKLDAASTVTLQNYLSQYQLEHL